MNLNDIEIDLQEDEPDQNALEGHSELSEASFDINHLRTKRRIQLEAYLRTKRVMKQFSETFRVTGILQSLINDFPTSGRFPSMLEWCEDFKEPLD